MAPGSVDFSSALSGCPACGTQEKAEPVETHFDRIGRKEYRLSRCAECGVVFSEPREIVGPDWYEKAAPIRALENRGDPEKDWRFAMFFSENLPPGKLLDVGCGDGGFVLIAKRRGFVVAGFDYEERMVRLARSRGITDVESAEFSEYCRRRSPGEFDYITMFDVLEHTPEPRWFLGELKRILKRGGHVAITLPNAWRPIPWVREEHDFPPHHFTRWSPEAMRGFLTRNGFRVVHQSAGRLRLRYISDHMYSYVIMNKVLGGVRRLLFGQTNGATISELYEKSKSSDPKAKHSWRDSLRNALSDKYFRQRLTNLFRAICLPLTVPSAAAMVAYYKIKNPDSGDYLYTLARYEP